MQPGAYFETWLWASVEIAWCSLKGKSCNFTYFRFLSIWLVEINTDCTSSGVIQDSVPLASDCSFHLWLEVIWPTSPIETANRSYFLWIIDEIKIICLFNAMEFEKHNLFMVLQNGNWEKTFRQYGDKAIFQLNYMQVKLMDRP